MAIINFTNNTTSVEGWVEGAYCPVDTSNGRMVIWEEYKGACVVEREYNGYDDSDFYMTVYNESTDTFSEIKFGTTRFWSGPAMGSYVDATDDVLMRWYAHKALKALEEKRAKRKAKAEALLALRAKVKSVSAEYGVSYGKLLKLAKLAKAKDVDIFSLFGKRVRNKFKLSLRERIVEWLNEESPKFAFPLSPNMIMYVPSWKGV